MHTQKIILFDDDGQGSFVCAWKHWNIHHKHLLIFFNPFECRIGHVWELFISHFMTGVKSFNIWVTSSSYSLNFDNFWSLILFYFIILGSIWKHCNTHIKGNWFPRQIWKFCQRSLCHWSWLCSKVKVSMTKWFLCVIRR